MRETNRAEKTMRDAGCEPDRASAEAARGCIRFRQEPDTQTGVSTVDTPAMYEYYPIRADLTTPLSILPQSIPGRRPVEVDHDSGDSTRSPRTTRPGTTTSAHTPNGSGSLVGTLPRW